MSKKNFLKGIKITYNAPVTLTFALISALVIICNSLLDNNLISAFFTAPGNSNCSVPFNLNQPVDYIRLILHSFGHLDWNHYLGNMAFILLLGPVIEDRYGSAILLIMMLITALVSGVLNACFSPSCLIGSSDIAFMMILLASFTSISKKNIPLSFILVLILYIGRELITADKNNNISTLAHIAGGLCGSLFAFLATPRPKQSGQNKAEESKRPSFYSKKQTEDSDATVVGTIEL